MFLAATVGEYETWGVVSWLLLPTSTTDATKCKLHTQPLLLYSTRTYIYLHYTHNSAALWALASKLANIA